MADYAIGMVVLVLVLFFLTRSIRSKLRPEEPEVGKPAHDFVLDLPRYLYWKYELVQAIELIEGELEQAKQRLNGLRALTKGRLSTWEKVCYWCFRIKPRLWIYAAVVTDAVLAVWLMYAAVSEAVIVRLHPDFWQPYEMPGLIVPGMEQGPFDLAKGLTILGAALLLLGAAVWLMAQVSTPRLKSQKAYLKAQKQGIPELNNLVSWLESRLEEKQRELAESLETERKYAD